MPQQTRAGRGPAETAADVAEVIEILAGRWQRAEGRNVDNAWWGPNDHDDGRVQGYRQAIAELLGTSASDVTLPAVLLAVASHALREPNVTGRSDD